MAGPRFETARFHVATGPEALFKRVRFKMQGRYELKVHPRHVQERAYDRQAPIEQLCQFDSERWMLRTAEVRVDKGKFVNTAWEVDVNGETWWVVIGFERTMKTVIRARQSKLGLGPTIVRTGPLFEFVALVNQKLMEEEVGSAEMLGDPPISAASVKEANET